MPLTNNEKARCRYHMGYPVTDPVASYQLGIPKPVQTAFLMESSLSLIQYEACWFRSLLELLDVTEANLAKAQCLLSAQRVGDIELRVGDEGKSTTDLLERSTAVGRTVSRRHARMPSLPVLRAFPQPICLIPVLRH